MAGDYIKPSGARSRPFRSGRRASKLAMKKDEEDSRLSTRKAVVAMLLLAGIAGGALLLFALVLGQRACAG
jgi:hypothetical protein